MSFNDWIFVTSQYYIDGEIMFLPPKTTHKVNKSKKRFIKYVALLGYWYVRNKFL